MTDEQFWDLADTYETCDEDDQPYVPINEAESLAREILKMNNWDYDESLADLNLFRFSNENNEDLDEEALKIFKKICQEKNIQPSVN